jgi:CRISPR-associated endonuclease/helicase Cas3
VIDVAEEDAAKSQSRVRERWLHTEGVDGSDYRRLMTRESGYPTTGLRERERVTLQLPAEGADEEGHGRWLVLMTQPTQASIDRAETAKIKQSLGFHEELIVEHMNRITDALGLEGDLKHALVMAAKWHDRGKGRPIWQWYAGNSGLFPPLAKSTKYLHSRALGGYRHEFGSMLEAADNEDIQRHPESDLILHLIAAHHGWSRPFFRTNAWRGIDTHTSSACEEMSTEAMRRFGNLQRRYGRWGLAWLESLVRCADIGASQGQEEGI